MSSMISTISNAGYAAGNAIEKKLLAISERGALAGRTIRDLTISIYSLGNDAGQAIRQGSAHLATYRPFSWVVAGVLNTALFIKRDWSQLLAVTIGWAVVVGCMGLMYGFKATALPLTIGLSIGFGGGIISGILVGIAANETSNPATIWSFLNSGINRLDSNGHRAILLSVAVTVITSATGVFPTAMGVGLGFILGNHLSTTIAFKQQLGPDKTSIQALVERLTAVEKETRSIREDLSKLNSAVNAGQSDGLKTHSLGNLTESVIGIREQQSSPSSSTPFLQK